MSIKIINTKPSPQVVKQMACRNCGVTLEYTPADTYELMIKDYTGDGELVRFIDCPNCRKNLRVS